ncbi:sugar nucleotide-binding protein [Psychromonas antarctica]|uniref:sugar nucleotide-binding protein n=1 Tax=Psychromonas antarctica TaxID=67573 RepID=UPI001EE8E867|nr:sugar nucleotide-binding protein [Psychromonas antarctica]MCG6200509.1 sugar nucleotide-binding protein [Psychromonas antarctica]
MKRLLITGLNGTVAPVVANLFKNKGWDIIAWDRSLADPENTTQSAAFFDQYSPDAVCHLAMGSESWAGWLAEKTKQKSIPYLFTSTAMVFANKPNGPFTIDRDRTANEQYGQYKIRCEDRIWQHNPDAMIARLGWQIGETAGGNNMLEHCHQQMQQNNAIEASTRWFPACSLIRVTAQIIYQLIERNEPGLYHIDSNTEEKLSFYELLQKLNQHHNAQWLINSSEAFEYDQRLLDNRIKVPSISASLEC